MSPLIEKEIQEGLERAATLLEEHGWCQNVSVDFHGHLCIVGALGRSFLQARATHQSYGLACNHLAHVIFGGRTTSSSVYDLSAWNYQGNRKKVDVIEALRKAVKTPLQETLLR